MNEEKIKECVERIKFESTIPKFLKQDVINQLIKKFESGLLKQKYPKKIKNPLKIVLQFYKTYNQKYYNLIVEGLNKNQIILSKNEKSYSKKNKTYINLVGNDSDSFIIVHELAHFIDLNQNIIPIKYSFLCEVFAFYIEKKFESFLKDEKYKKLKEVRRNNRLYFESKMLKAIEQEWYYENLYKKKGKIVINERDKEKLKIITHFDYDLKVGLINYLLRYPLANWLSEYLLSLTSIKEEEFVKICLNTNLYEILEKIKF